MNKGTQKPPGRGEEKTREKGVSSESEEFA
jgi:hypothetical protein